MPAAALVPGDLLLVEAGDLVAADARLLEEAGLETNEAALTGESVPVSKSPGRLRARNAARRSATTCCSSAPRSRGAAAARWSWPPECVPSSARSPGCSKRASSEQTPLQRQLDRVGHRLLWFCLGIVALIFALGLMRAVPIFELFLGAMSLAVAAIPEGLPAIVTVALALGVSRMARRNALVRRLHSVETLGCAQVICTDKTGTLTLGEMTARKVVTADRVFDVTGEGYSTDGAIFADGDSRCPGTTPRCDDLLRAAVACNDAHLTSQAGRPAIVGDPTEGALLVLAAKAGITPRAGRRADGRRVGTIAFTSERKRMTVVVKANGGLIAYTKGAPEMVLARCSRIRTRDGVRPLGTEDRARMTEANAMMASDALRVIACARRSLEPSARGGEAPIDEAEIERDLEFLGLVGMQDPPRAEAREAVRKCERAGIRTVMITGDHPANRRRDRPRPRHPASGRPALGGAELERMSDEELRERVAEVSVYGRVTAEHKLRIVRAWKSHGAVVAMTGDGVNDAPALKEAAIGVAMGISGTEVTKAGRRHRNRRRQFRHHRRGGRGRPRHLRQRGQDAALSDGRKFRRADGDAGRGRRRLAAAAAADPVALDQPGLRRTARARAGDRSDRPRRAASVRPRPPQAEIISRGFMGRVMLVGCLSAGVTLIAFGYAIHSGMDLARARNAAFFVLVVEELMRAFGARSADKPLWRIGMLTNLRLVAVVLVSFALQLVISATPLMEEIFQTQRITLAECAVGILLGLIPLSILELMKITSAKRKSPQALR